LKESKEGLSRVVDKSLWIGDSLRQVAVGILCNPYILLIKSEQVFTYFLSFSIFYILFFSLVLREHLLPFQSCRVICCYALTVVSQSEYLWHQRSNERLQRNLLKWMRREKLTFLSQNLLLKFTDCKKSAIPARKFILLIIPKNVNKCKRFLSWNVLIFLTNVKLFLLID